MSNAKEIKEDFIDVASLRECDIPAYRFFKDGHVQEIKYHRCMTMLVFLLKFCHL